MLVRMGRGCCSQTLSTPQQPELRLTELSLIQNGLTSDYDCIANSVSAETEPGVDGSGFLHMVSLY